MPNTTNRWHYSLSLCPTTTEFKVTRTNFQYDSMYVIHTHALDTTANKNSRQLENSYTVIQYTIRSHTIRMLCSYSINTVQSGHNNKPSSTLIRFRNKCISPSVHV